jgi:predicted HTH transcriptional regulator
MLTVEELRGAIALGREQRGVEFKGPGQRTKKAFMAKVVRAIIGMANKPGGGVVVLGINDDGTSLHPIGLAQEELATWKYDDLASSVSNYADPYVDFDVGVLQMDAGRYVVIEVRQFDELPILCKKDLTPTLRNGALYVRRRGKNETVEAPTHVELREVINRAVEISARELMAKLIRLRELAEVPEASVEAAQVEFDREAGDLL